MYSSTLVNQQQATRTTTQLDVPMATYSINNTAATQGGFPVQPTVQLKRLPFYDNLGVLLKPSTLIPSNSQRLQESTFFFHLSPAQATDIAMNRDMRNATKIEHTIQVGDH